jgi:hypothetical protein
MYGQFLQQRYDFAINFSPFDSSTEIEVWMPFCRPCSPVRRNRAPIPSLFAAWWQGSAFFENKYLKAWLSIDKSAYILLSRECSSSKVYSF